MTMRVDAYTHFFPQKFFDKLEQEIGDYKDMGKRVRSLPALFDVDVRKKIVDGHKDYQQILSYPQPPVEKFAKQIAERDGYGPIQQELLTAKVLDLLLKEAKIEEVPEGTLKGEAQA